MSVQTLTLADFLLARIAEDERYATHAGGMMLGVEAGANSLPHINRWRPVRVLAECEAKRAIVDLFRLLDGEVREAAARRDPETERDARNSRFAVQLTMQALALPYADHPDYRDEWRP